MTGSTRGKDIFVHSGTFLSLRMGENLLVLPLDSKPGPVELSFFSLNETGSRIWELVDGNRNLADVARALREHYESPPEDIDRDVFAMADGLLAHGLLRPAAEGQGADTPGNVAPEPEPGSVPREVMQRQDDHVLDGPSLVYFAREVLKRSQRLRFHARGASMVPFIRDNDVVTLKPVDVKRLRPGHVVAFVAGSDRALILHRIIRRDGDLFVTRGDGTRAPDAPFPGDRILGAVSRVERRGQRVRMGNGPERVAIAHASRTGLLRLLLRTMNYTLRPLLGAARRM